MSIAKLGLTLAAVPLLLSACSGNSTPNPHPTTTDSTDARADFVGAWVLDSDRSILIKQDGTFAQADCNTDGGTWQFRQSDHTIALAYTINRALGCGNSSDFRRATIGYMHGHVLLLKNTNVGDTKRNQVFVLAKK